MTAGLSREKRLPAGAYEAIFAEHERDHQEAGASRDGCNGCAMLAHASALERELAEAKQDIETQGKFHRREVMAERNKHLFQFRAGRIADAAKAEAAYHQDRLNYWTAELNKAVIRVQETASVKVVMQEVTGGAQPTVVVDYGDPAAYSRMLQAGGKIRDHDTAMKRYTSDADLYSTQDRIYELDGDDVAHFRLNGRERHD